MSTDSSEVGQADREIQGQLKGQGIELSSEADEESSGAASLTLLDPDGNPILIDQHF